MPVLPGYGFGGASYSGGVISGQITWADGLGAIDHIEGPSDEDLKVTPGTGMIVHLVQPGNMIGLHAQKTGTGNGDVVLITNEGTEPGLRIDQNGDGPAIEVDNEGDAVGLDIVSSGSGTQPVLRLLKSSGTGSCVEVICNTNSPGLLVEQNGSAVALSVEQNTASLLALLNQKANADCLELRKLASGSGDLLVADNDGTGEAIRIEQSGNPSTSSLHLLKTGAGGGVCIEVENSGTGNGVLVDNTGDATCLWLRMPAGASSHCVFILHDGSGHAMDITNPGSGKDIDGNGSNWYALPDGKVKVGVFTNGTRGSPPEAGTIIFNTNDGQLNISDGANWTLPDGSTT
jgi:hypothetical protein